MKFTIIVARIFAFGFLSSLIACLSMAREPIDDMRGYLLKIEDLPRLHTGVQTHQFCTYDRAGDHPFSRSTVCGAIKRCLRAIREDIASPAKRG